MRIISIQLKNIKSHRDTQLCFSPGINVLAGPNGAGKSSVFEAIGYALFGVDARDFVSNVERFLTIGTKRGEVVVTFLADDGINYRVSRSVGSGAKWLLAKEIGGSFEVEEHAGIEETGARISKLLGLDNGRPLSEQFKQVIAPLQNDFLGPFVIRQATRRQETFDEILGIDAWRKTYKGTSSMLSAIQERVNVLQAEISAKEEQAAALPDKSAELAAIRAEIVRDGEKIGKASTALAAVECELGELDSREKALAAMESELRILESRIKNGLEKSSEQQSRVRESEEAEKAVAGSRPGKEAFDRAEAALGELRLKEKERRRVEQDITVLEREADRLTQSLSHERAEIDRVEKELASELERLASARRELLPDDGLVRQAAPLEDLRTAAEELRAQRSLLDGRLEGLNEGKAKLDQGVCPYLFEQCMNVAGSLPRDAFSSRVAVLVSESAELDSRISRLSSEILVAEKGAAELKNREARLDEISRQESALKERGRLNQERADSLKNLAKLQAESCSRVEARRGDLLSFAAMDEEIAAMVQEMELHRGASVAYLANLAIASDLASRVQQLEKMQTLLAELQREQQAKGDEYALLKGSYRVERHQELRSDKERLVAEAATLRQKIIDLERNGHRLEGEIELLNCVKADIAGRRAEIARYAEKEKLVKFLRKEVFNRMSSQLSERFREEISQRGDRIYRTIAESDEELVWGENYRIILRDMVDGVVRERSDDQLSGGQTMSAVVALRLALLQTIGARFACFDEPTSNLDSTRRENLAKAFRAIDVGREEVSEHWYDQLFLVSHDVAFTEITDQMILMGEEQ